jgi:hypothetical protein
VDCSEPFVNLGSAGLEGQLLPIRNLSLNLCYDSLSGPKPETGGQMIRSAERPCIKMAVDGETKGETLLHEASPMLFSHFKDFIQRLGYVSSRNEAAPQEDLPRWERTPCSIEEGTIFQNNLNGSHSGRATRSGTLKEEDLSMNAFPGANQEAAGELYFVMSSASEMQARPEGPSASQGSRMQYEVTFWDSPVQQRRNLGRSDRCRGISIGYFLKQDPIIFHSRYQHAKHW